MYFLSGNSPRFPLELLLEIGWYCDQPTLNALCQTCKAIAKYMTSVLYDRRIFPHKNPQKHQEAPEEPLIRGFVPRLLECARIWKSEPVLTYFLKTFKHDTPCLRVILPAPRKPDGKCTLYPFLHMMALGGNLFLVKRLIEAGASVDQPTKENRRTPLHCACKGGHEDVANYLLDEEACVWKRDMKKLSMLCLAASKAPPALLVRLIQGLRDDGVDPFRAARKGMRSIHFAARAGNDAAVRLFLEYDVDPAAPARYIRIVQSRGTVREDKTPLTLAFQRGNEATAVALVEAMVKRGYNISRLMWSGRTPLHFAVRLGYETLARCLIESGANVHAVDISGRSPLHDAVTSQNKSLAMVRLLISSGADPTAADPQGVMPFSHVVDEDEYVDVLLEGTGGWIGRRVKGKLWEAARNGRIPRSHFQFLDRLLRAPLPLGKIDQHGNTALHVLAQVRIGSCDGISLEMAKILINAGAEVAAKNCYGYTPFHYAVREFCRCGPHMAPFLLKYRGIHGGTSEENEAVREMVDRDLTFLLEADKDGDPLTRVDGKTRVDLVVDGIQEEELARRARKLLAVDVSVGNLLN
ncbi:ankyrin repeat-containing domain protein [Aspergillus unguis]